jgi:hypothetical protein
MPGLVPGIYVLPLIRRTWMAGTSLDKPGLDELEAQTAMKVISDLRHQKLSSAH